MEQKAGGPSLEDEKWALRKTLSLNLKRAARRVDRCKSELEACLSWNSVQHEALLLQSHFFMLKKGLRHIDIPDWEDNQKPRSIALDPNLTPAEEVKARFKRVRKLREGLPHWQAQLKEAEARLESARSKLSELEAIESEVTLKEFNKALGCEKSVQKIIKKPQVKALPYREFLTAAGLQIWVGKSAKDNETLTFHLARGSDWWLHVKDFSGSHVILRTKNRQEPDQESFQDAIQLALYYSQARKRGEAEVCLTQCKYVSRIGGRLGAVQIAKQRTVKARHNEARIKNLLQK